MTERRDKRAKEIQNAIRAVLYREWDPIGVCDAGPKDEYDSYIGRIYRLLVLGSSRETLARELQRIESDCMGLEQTKGDALRPIADRLLAIDIGPAP